MRTSSAPSNRLLTAHVATSILDIDVNIKSWSRQSDKLALGFAWPGCCHQRPEVTGRHSYRTSANVGAAHIEGVRNV